MNEEEVLKQPIPKVQELLIAMDKSKQITVDEMRKLLSVEAATKGRKGISEWLRLGIAWGRLPDQHYLTYNDRLGIFKSALQKYIRRSQPEKGVRAAKSLWMLGKASGIARLKIIIPEETVALGLLEHFSEAMTEAQFLGMVKTLCEAPKDKSSCPLAARMDEEKVDISPKPDFLRNNLQDRNQLPLLARQAFALCKRGRHDELIAILGGSKVVTELVYRQKRGTFWGDDSTLLIVAAVRFAQNDYDHSIYPQTVNPSKVRPLKLSEVDWFVLDFHTAIGRILERRFLEWHPEIDQRQFRRAWFMAEGGRLEGKVIPSAWDKEPYDKALWLKHKDEIEDLTHWAIKKFRLESYDTGGLVT